MQMKVFSLSVLDIMEPIMQSITFKIEVVTIRTKTDKKKTVPFYFFFFFLINNFTSSWVQQSCKSYS